MSIKVIHIIGENYGEQDTFVEELYTRNQRPVQSILIMKSKVHEKPCLTNTNRAPTLVLPLQTRNRILNFIINYFFDFRYVKCILHAVNHYGADIMQIRDRTFPLLVCLMYRVLCGGVKVIYQKSHPMELSQLEWVDNNPGRFSLLRRAGLIVENKILHRALKYCDAVLPISRYMAENLMSVHDIPGNLLFPCGMGVNPQLTPSPRRHDRSGPFQFIYVGTLAPSRKPENMLMAFASLLALTGTGDIALSVVGGRPAQIASLRALASDLGVNEKVRFFGHVSRASVYELIRESDAGISYIPDAQRFVDSWPTKVMEYLALGKPAVVTDAALLQRDIVKWTGAGLVCRDDIMDLAEKMKTMIDDCPKLTANAEKSSRQIRNQFGYDKIKQNMIAFYQILLGSGTGAANDPLSIATCAITPHPGCGAR